jgi:putative ABC transport system permease protein
VRAPFWLKLALREARSSAHRLAVYMGAITLGVAALVAINSFRAQVVESVDSESRALLGADLRLDSNRAFPDSITAIIDSAANAGVPVSRITTTVSVALTQAGNIRLVQVRGVEGDYPFYGEMTSEPAGVWRALRQQTGTALVELPLLAELDVAIGDSVRLGDAWFEIRGALTSLPPELSFRNAIGPRVYIAAVDLPRTGLLQFGSLARYEAYFQIRNDAELQRFVDRNHDTFRRAGVGFDTAAEQAENLAEALESLGRFLGLVGLSALLLGGLGVASAVNVFVKDKRATVAVLRCLGAAQRTAFGAYLFQATAIGTLGALLGAVLGVAIQALLPGLIGSELPIDVPFSVQWTVVLVGVAIGALVAFTFALLPLLEVRGITPLRALRHDVDEATRFDPWRIAAFALIMASVVAVAIWQARIWQVGAAYAAALIIGMGVLWVCARALTTLARRSVRRGSAVARRASGATRRRTFALRQGIANLHRPRNQTTAVTMALGFGVFLVATLWTVQQNLLGWMRTDVGRPQPNLVFFDIQRDQIDTLTALFGTYADAPADIVPIVPARLTAINGKTVDELLEERPRRVEPWALRREYRHTYRDSLTGPETLVDGTFHSSVSESESESVSDGGTAGRVAGGGGGAGGGAGGTAVARVSIEQDVARNLDVGVGDTITWDVTGVPVRSVITSVRTVDWARFETNFFFVFESGVLEQAPQSAVSLVAVADDSARAALQRAVVQRFGNVSVVDLANVQRIISRIVNRVTFAIRFMAAFSVGAGVLVLFGAIAASRYQRVRETALLRALGATRRQVRTVMLTEYAALGALAAFTGVILAAIAGWLAMRFVFRMPFTLPLASLATIFAIVTLSAAILGMYASLPALRGTPVAALRDS